MTYLCDLARKYGCDKGGDHYIAGDICHRYTEIYNKLLWGDRHLLQRVLEIGVNTGASLKMWEEYFPNALIWGVDIAKCSAHFGPRVSVFYADQTNPDELRHVVGRHKFDLIIDDGSHAPEHQETSLRTLLPSLAEHGRYVVEDLTRDLVAVPGYTSRYYDTRPALGPQTYRHQLFVVQPE